MTYFHIRTYTIIGAKSFHCPVRDGKEWGQLAMVVRHNWRLIESPGLGWSIGHCSEEVKRILIAASETMSPVLRFPFLISRFTVYLML